MQSLKTPTASHPRSASVTRISALATVLSVAATAHASVSYMKVDALLTAQQSSQGFDSYNWYAVNDPNIAGVSWSIGTAYANTSAFTVMSAFDDRVSFHFLGFNSAGFETPSIMRAVGSIWFFSTSAQFAQYFVTVPDPSQGSWSVQQMDLHNLTSGDSLASSWYGTIPPLQPTPLGSFNYYRLDFDIVSYVLAGETASQAVELRFSNGVPAPGAIAMALLSVQFARRRRR